MTINLQLCIIKIKLPRKALEITWKMSITGLRHKQPFTNSAFPQRVFISPWFLRCISKSAIRLRNTCIHKYEKYFCVQPGAGCLTPITLFLAVHNRLPKWKPLSFIEQLDQLFNKIVSYNVLIKFWTLVSIFISLRTHLLISLNLRSWGYSELSCKCSTVSRDVGSKNVFHSGNVIAEVCSREQRKKMDGFSEWSEAGGTVKTLPRSDLRILENEETAERWRYLQVAWGRLSGAGMRETLWCWWLRMLGRVVRKSEPVSQDGGVCGMELEEPGEGSTGQAGGLCVSGWGGHSDGILRDT